MTPSVFVVIAWTPFAALITAVLAPKGAPFVAVMLVAVTFALLTALGRLPDPGYERMLPPGQKGGPTPLEISAILSALAVLSVAPAQAWRWWTDARARAYAGALAVSILGTALLLAFLFL